MGWNQLTSPIRAASLTTRQLEGALAAETLRGARATTSDHVSWKILPDLAFLFWVSNRQIQLIRERTNPAYLSDRAVLSSFALRQGPK